MKEVGTSGMSVLIEGSAGKSDRVILLRADMDALPMKEINDAILCKGNTAHTCGHDLHATMLLGAANPPRKS